MRISPRDNYHPAEVSLVWDIARYMEPEVSRHHDITLNLAPEGVWIFLEYFEVSDVGVSHVRTNPLKLFGIAFEDAITMPTRCHRRE